MAPTELSSQLLGPLVRGSPIRQLSAHRAIVLLLTFIIYATYRMSRRPLSIAKSVLNVENCTEVSLNGTVGSCGWAPFDGDNGKEILGLLDSSFLFVYAFGMFAAGYIAERVSIRLFLAASLTSCGLLSIGLGLAQVWEIHSLPYFVVLQVLMGLSQTGLPAVIAVVGSWYGSSKKGLIFGFWNWHTSVGNMLGAAIAGAFIETNWSLSFIVPGLICIAVALLVLLFLIPNPSHVGLAVDASQLPEKLPEKSPKLDLNGNFAEKPTKKPAAQAISVWSALLIPGVIEFSLCLFFTKLVSYTFLYWLPLYLKETSNLSSSESAYASLSFDIGGCLGAISIGLLADLSGSSSLTCIGFLLASIPSMYSYYLFSSQSKFLNELLQALAGATINGPFSLIMATVSANLACKVPSKSAMATVSALINGTGTFGAALGPSLAGYVSASSWKAVFGMCIVADILAALCLSRIGVKDAKKMMIGKRAEK